MNISSGWNFYGDDNGYVAVKPQESGLLKLVGIFGDDEKTLTKAFKELTAQDSPVWGAVALDVKKVAEKANLKALSPTLTKMLSKTIPNNIFEREQTKYIIANDQCIEWLNNVTANNSTISKPTKFLVRKLLDKLARSQIIVKTASTVTFENWIDISEAQ